MKTVTASFLLSASVTMALAQDMRLSQDEARGFAKLCVEQTTLSDAQIKTEVDPDQPCAVRGEGGGAMAIPDKKLSKDIARKVGKDVIPLGQLWLRKWTTVVKDEATPKEKLRIVTVNIEKKDRPMALFLLGIRRKSTSAELVVYAKENEPFQVIPLKKLDQIPDLPLEIEWKRGEKQADGLTLTIAGKYQGVLLVTRQPD
jgi:hypothetical protein